MSHSTNRSNRRKWMLALLTVALVVSLCVEAFAFAAEGDTPVNVSYVSVKAELAQTADIPDNHTAESIKNILKVTAQVDTGKKNEGKPVLETVTVPADKYDVVISGGALSSAEGAANSVTVTFNDSVTLPEGTDKTVTVEIPAGAVIATAYTYTVAVPGYTLDGNYYVDANGYDAFVQGMSSADVLSRLAIAKGSNNPYIDPEIITNVSWKDAKSVPATFGDASSTVNFVAEVTITDGTNDATATINFNTLHEFALAIENDWTQPAGLNSGSAVLNFAASLQGKVYTVYNNGERVLNANGNTQYIDATSADYLSQNTLVGLTADAFINGNSDYKYDITIEIPAGSVNSTLKPLVLNLKGITYKAPDDESNKTIQGDIPTQYARSELNLGTDLYISVGYRVGRQTYNTQVSISTLIKAGLEISEIVYYIGDSAQPEGTTLTRAINGLDFKCGNYNYSGNLFVEAIAVDRPSMAHDGDIIDFSDNCFTTVSGLVTDDPQNDNMQLNVIEGADGVELQDDGSYKFLRGGTYKFQVTFVKDDASDFRWSDNGGGDLSSDRKIVTYEITVAGAALELAVNGFPTEFQYGDSEPNIAGYVSGTVEGSPSMSMPTGGLGERIKDDLPVFKDDNPNMTLTTSPRYRVVYTGTYKQVSGTTETDVEYTDKYKFPTERGSYKMYIETEPTSYYKYADIEPISFTIEKRQITLGAISIASKTFDKTQSYSIDDLIGSGNDITVSGLVNGDTVATVMDLSWNDGSASTVKRTHADDYAIKFVIKSLNYKWDNDDAFKTANFSITKRQLSFDLSQSGITYGENLPDAVISNDGSLSGYVTLKHVYKDSAGNEITTVPNPANNELWNAGSYSVEYSIGNYEEGVLATDVECSSKTASFTVARREITKVSVDLANNNKTYNGSAYTFAINNFKVGDQTLANGSTYLYENILKVERSGKLLTDGTTAITTITYDEHTGIISVIDAGTYTFKITIINANFTWAGEGNSPSAVEATATINQYTLSFKLDQSEFSFTGENQLPKVSVDWKLGEALTETLTLEYYDGENNKIDKSSVINAGDYKVKVTDVKIAENVSGAGYSYVVNYKLPDDSSLAFVIKTPYLARPTIKGNGKVVYQGSNNPYDILDYIEGDTYTYTANGEVKCNLVFTYAIGETEQSSLAIAGTYTVTVAPAENFQWKNAANEADGVEPVTLTFVIEQKEVTLTWSADVTYNGNGYLPTATAQGLEAIDAGKVDVTVTYDDGDVSKTNAGKYVVKACELTGDSASNYKLPSAVTHDFTIKKQLVTKPQIGALDLTYNGNTQNVDLTQYGYVYQTNYGAGNMSAEITGYYPTSFGLAANLPFDTTDSAKYAFNVANGVFAFTNAGTYSVTFTLGDSANYCWDDSFKGTNSIDFANTYKYTFSKTNFVTVKRQVLTAPKLGDNRAMEFHEGVIDLTTLFTGTLNGVEYDVLFGNAVTDATDHSQSVIDGYTAPTEAGKNGSADRGQYYVKLSVKDNALNYVWEVPFDNATNDGYAKTGFLNGDAAFELIYTEDNGAQVKLRYAITASQVNIEVDVQGYTYGDNGAYIGQNENAKRIGELVANGIDGVITLTVPAGFTDATWNNSNHNTATGFGGGGSVTYTFYKKGETTPVTDLVNNLPWEAGEYNVKIKIVFDKNAADEEVYSTWDSEEIPFTVSKRGMEVSWSYNGTDAVDNALSVVYNGTYQMPTAAITNLPYKKDLNDVDAPELVYNLTGISRPLDAKTAAYEIKVTAADGNFDVSATSVCKLTITKRDVYIETKAVTNHVYGDAILDAEKVWGYTAGYGDDNEFVGGALGYVNMVILLNGAGADNTSATTPVGTYKLCAAWSGYDSSNPLPTTMIDSDGNYTLDVFNYVVHVHAADFVVVERKVTVTFTENGGTSVYGNSVNLYQNGVIFTVNATNSTGDAIVNKDGDGNVDFTQAFTLAAYLGENLVTETNTKLWDAKTYRVVGSQVDGNYTVTFVNHDGSANGEGKYVITNAAITDVSVEGYSGTYDAAKHAMFTVSATTVNDLDKKWFFQKVGESGEVNESGWTEYTSQTVKNVLDTAKYFVKVTADNHDEAIYKLDGANAQVEVTVTKATLKVQINLAIWYGEAKPSAYNGTDAFKATLDELKSNSVMYTVSGFKGTEDNIGNIGLVGQFRYTTDYSQGDGAGEYGIIFDKGTLVASNYDIVNAENDDGETLGVLTVRQLALTVAIDDIENVYYDTYDKVEFVTAVTLPKSTYTDETLVQSELAESVWNNIFDTNAAYQGANIVTLTTTAYDDTNAATHSKKVGEYVISGELKSADPQNYSAAFTGSSGTTAKHIIKAATLNVNDISGYTGGYDEQVHLALIVKVKDGETVTTEFATAVDGADVTVHFYAAAYAENAAAANALEWSDLTLTTTPYEYIDVCDYNVYYRITADNHETVYGVERVQITKVDNAFTNTDDWNYQGWTYGLYDATVNPDGYNVGSTHKTVEPKAQFTRLISGETVTNNVFTFALTRNGSAIEGLGENYATVEALFADMWTKGLFTAGEYELTVSMAGTNNYEGLEETRTFTVSKKELTVTANTQKVIYGDDAPAYTYTVAGFVIGISGGRVQTETEILGETKHNFFTSDYAAGRINGSAGTYLIKHFEQDGNITIEGLDDVTLDNYTLKFVTDNLTVDKREITVSINDAENFYHRITLQGNNYGVEAEAEWSTGYTVENVYGGDVENGVQKVFALNTEALNSTDGHKTNNVGKYAIYAEWLTFENDESYSQNYTVKFTSCSYTGDLPDTAIKQDDVNCAGTYTIKQAILSVDILGPYLNATEGDETSAVNGSVFSNTPKYYKANVTQGADDTVKFVMTYYKNSVSDANKLDGAPVNVGSYWVTATADNKNYIASLTQQPFTITPAALTVKWAMDEESAQDDTAATIQYGEKIPALNGNVYPKNDRFSGLKFVFSSTTHFPDLSEEALIELLGTITYGYDTGYDDSMPLRRIYITPEVKVSDNFTVSAERGYLSIVAREITVRVKGYGEGNTSATSKYTGKAPFDGNTSTGITGWTVNAWLTTLDTDAFVHGHTLNSLAIALSLDSRSYDASETPYSVNVSKSSEGIAGYYKVTFVVGDGNVSYGAGEGQAKPTYLITKKDLTVKVNDVTVTYGNAIDQNVISGIAHGSVSAEIIAKYFVISGFENNESYTTLSDEIMRDNRFVFTTEYKPYESHVGDNIELTVKNSTLIFKNYEIVNNASYTSGKVVVVPRLITAATHDEVYTEALDGDENALYNNGVYGAARNAQITFTGHDNGVGYEKGYAPAYSLSYTTVAGAGQTAGTAPTKVGGYTVTVTLTNDDYVFAADAKTHDLEFNVNKKTLSPFWLHDPIANNPKPGETAPDLDNSVADYIASIMTLSNFQKTTGDGVIDIIEGTEADQYRIGDTVGDTRVGLYITAYATGEYRVTLTLTDSAKANYQWNDEDSAASVTLIFNVTTNQVLISGLNIAGWEYGKYDAEKNKAVFKVSDNNKDRVQITYARITGDVPTSTEDYKKLSYSAILPVDAGTYAIRAYYPTFQGLGGDEKYTTFVITKATLTAPQITVTEENCVYSGNQLTATVEFDPLAIRVNGFNGTDYALTESGATLHAVNKGTYVITFGIIDSTNYQWGDNASTASWTVSAAQNNAVTWNNTDEQKNLVYGNRFAPNATATYGGTVYYNYMRKTDSTVPSADDANWVETFSKFNVGEYWVKATCYASDNYNGDVQIISIVVNKAVLTVTPSGSMIYGNAFENATLNYVITDGVVWGDGADEIIRKTGEISYSIVNRPDTLNADTYALKLDSNDDGVVGLEADNYKIVSAQGTFTVNKRSIVVNVGNKTSQYGRTVDVSDVTFGYGSVNGLVPGDDLGLMFATDATATSNVGGYIITATYTNQNYNATINPGTYTITARLITVEIGQGGGVYGGTIAPVQCTKVLGDENEDITAFVNGKLTLRVVYSGSDNAGNVLPADTTTVPTNAGSYLATVKGAENNDNFIIVGEPFTTFTVEKKAVDGSLITIANQTYTGSALTPVIDAGAFIAAYGENVYTELAHNDFIDAGSYSVTLRINDFANYKWQSVEIDERNVAFVIDKANNALTSSTIEIAGWIYGEYDETANAPNATVLFGQDSVTYVYCSLIDGVYHSGAPMTGDVGDYWIKVTVPATDNYNAYTSEPVKFAISKKALTIPTLRVVSEGDDKNDVYTGGELYSALVGFDMALMNLNYDGKFNVNSGLVTVIAVNAGTYNVTVSIDNTMNYRWNGEDDDTVTLTWIVSPKAIAKPTANNRTFMVNGQVLTYVPEGFDEETMTISGNTTAYGGEFPVTIGLKDKANYVWVEGGTDDFTLTWNVVGINTVFVIVASVIGGASAVALMAVGIQFLLDHRKKRLIDRDIDKRSKAEGEPKTKKEKNNEGGND